MENYNEEIKRLDRNFIDYLLYLKDNQNEEELVETLRNMYEGLGSSDLTDFGPQIIALELKKLLQISEENFMQNNSNSNEDVDNVGLSLEQFLIDLESGVVINYDDSYNNELRSRLVREKKEIDFIDITRRDIEIDSQKVEKGVCHLLDIEKENRRVARIEKKKKEQKKKRRFKATKVGVASALTVVSILLAASKIPDVIAKAESAPVITTTNTEEEMDTGLKVVEDITIYDDPFAKQIDVFADIEPIAVDYYVECACPEELQDLIKEKADENKIPFEFMMAIIYKESGGNYNTTGVISPSNDYGLCQINKANHYAINQALGYTSEDLLYDNAKNLDAACWIIHDIMRMRGMKDYDTNPVFTDNDLLYIASAYNQGMPGLKYANGYAYDVQNLYNQFISSKGVGENVQKK